MTMTLNIPMFFASLSTCTVISDACSRRTVQEDEVALLTLDSHSPDTVIERPIASRGQDDSREGYKRIFAHVIYRHGDRAPLFHYAKDIYSAKDWPRGLEHLTTKGMKQQFLLGKYLRKRYSDFLSPHYVKEEIYVRSTDERRTQESAQANLAGLYSLKTDKVWNPDLIPDNIEIHTVPHEDDYSLIIKHPCPEYQKISKHDCATSFKAYNEFYESFFAKVSEHTGENVTITSLLKVYDPLVCEFEHNLPLPKWTQKKYDQDSGIESKRGVTAFELIVYLRTEAMNLFYNTAKKAKLTAGYLLGEILERLRKVAAIIDPTGIEATKLMMYSGKDNVIMPLLYAIRVTGIDYPFMVPCAAAVFIELYEKEGEYFVEVSFKTKPPDVDCKDDDCKHAEQAEPLNHAPDVDVVTLLVTGCTSSMCPLERFAASVESRTSYPREQRDEDCGVTTKRVIDEDDDEMGPGNVYCK